MKTYRITNKITLKANLDFERTKIMNYTIRYDECNTPMIWSKGYALESCGLEVPFDLQRPNWFRFTKEETKKIFEVMCMIEELFAMEVKE